MKNTQDARPCMARLIALLGFVTTTASGGEFETTVPMLAKSAATYYVSAQIADADVSEFMVDTGSGYLTINENTLAGLQESGRVHFVKDLSAILADGSRLVVPVYTISSLRIGTQCTLHDVEAAVFPGKTRQILGLSALNKAAPFIFSINPPQLVLSNCGDQEIADSTTTLSIADN